MVMDWHAVESLEKFLIKLLRSSTNGSFVEDLININITKTLYFDIFIIFINYFFLLFHFKKI